MSYSTCLQTETEERRSPARIPGWDELGNWPEGRWRWPDLTSGNVDVVLAAARRLGGRPGVQFIGADCVIDVAGTSIDDHVAALPTRQRRTSFQREQRRFAESGLEIRRTDLAGIQGAKELSARLRAQAGQPGTVIFACFDGDILVGFSLACERGAELALRIVDFDNDRAGGYAQLAVHAPLRYCYQRRLRRLQLGTESYQAKCRRGARPRPLWAVTSSPSPDAWSFTRAVRRIAAALPARESASFAAQAEQAWRGWVEA
ncbi:MAG TPA: hypothetical protein VFI65_32165 [Streptosporangiaceae bacterium]|nr:hypothetical protein [Streptosporangiaceae bacterium]